MLHFHTTGGAVGFTPAAPQILESNALCYDVTMAMASLGNRNLSALL